MSNKMSQYLTLPATASKIIFPDNTLSHYRVKLANRLRLQSERHAVALTDLTYPVSWYNITEGKITLRYINPNGLKTIYHVNILPGTEFSIYNILRRIEKAAQILNVKDKFSLHYQSYDNKSILKVENESYDISFSKDLALIFGFQINKYYSQGLHEGVRSTDTKANCRLIYVYSSIVKDRPVGDTQAPLLRHIPANGDPNEMISVEFKNLHYLPARSVDTDELEVMITTDEGKLIDFQSGKVSITLHIKEV